MCRAVGHGVRGEDVPLQVVMLSPQGPPRTLVPASASGADHAAGGAPASHAVRSAAGLGHVDGATMPTTSSTAAVEMEGVAVAAFSGSEYGPEYLILAEGQRLVRQQPDDVEGWTYGKALQVDGSSWQTGWFPSAYFCETADSKECPAKSEPEPEEEDLRDSEVDKSHLEKELLRERHRADGLLEELRTAGRSLQEMRQLRHDLDQAVRARRLAEAERDAERSRSDALLQEMQRLQAIIQRGARVQAQASAIWNELYDASEDCYARAVSQHAASTAKQATVTAVPAASLQQTTPTKRGQFEAEDDPWNAAAKCSWATPTERHGSSLSVYQ
eukprot:gnl/TRDRNA2_/TRDRNA2_199433_c0_seq1.p1 gnl/TRDRNA2_/TRDRNA2_199433_c0~~gnl/TRDRNA2_/TRDRNA2_199433_c0_seq1.p1  ORF type:complete len:330 (-),score=58.32 gnl/TRDRNA2_/TRDRNA2_199433_c0_seq1:11-1000(-)